MKTTRLLAGASAALALLLATAAVAQPRGWSSAGLRRAQIFRMQYYQAPYQGWYCVRVVDENGRVQGWRQQDRRRLNVVRGTLGIPGVMSLNAALAVLGAAPPPPQAPSEHLHLRLVFRNPGGGLSQREYAGPLPAPARTVVNLVNGAVPGSGGCRI